MAFAHDSGGALMLAAAAPCLEARGHDVRYIGVGPAIAAWQNAGLAVVRGDIDVMEAEFGADVIVTGTGFSSHERDMWTHARRAGVPTLAVVDAWTNMARRFTSENGFVVPDAIGVLDETVRSELEAYPWWNRETYVIGQAHLQVQTARLTKDRAERKPADGPLVFFSEPVLEDFGGSRGFNQFRVFEAFMARAEGSEGQDILVKPHPREDAARWQSFVDDRVSLTDRLASDLLVSARGVVGMTTMVLIEAHLLGIPILSLQPERTSIANPLVDEIEPPVLDWSTFPDAWRVFRSELGVYRPVAPRFAALLEDADNRLVDALEAVSAHGPSE